MAEVIAVSALLAAGAASYSSYAGAKAQNEGLKKAAEADQAAASIQARQVNEQKRTQRDRALQESAKLRAALQVSAGEAGIGLGGSTQQRANQVAFNTAEQIAAIERGAGNNIMAINSQSLARQTTLAGQAVSTTGAAVQGGIQGLSTGLAIGGALNSTFGPKPQQ